LTPCCLRESLEPLVSRVGDHGGNLRHVNCHAWVSPTPPKRCKHETRFYKNVGVIQARELGERREQFGPRPRSGNCTTLTWGVLRVVVRSRR